VREGKARFEVSESNPEECGTVSSGKGEFPQRNIAFTFRKLQGKNYGIKF